MSQASLEGKTALVTGASRGIGRSIALALAAAGARVVLAARSTGELEALAVTIAAAGGTAIAQPVDVTHETLVERLLAAAHDAWGRLDLVVNNAGIGIFKPLAETSVEEWDRVMAVNVRGPFLVCRASLPYLKRSGGGVIINIASVVAFKGYANQSAYGASKHALLGMSKALAREVQSEGIRVHVVCPGGVDTPMGGEALPGQDRSVLMQPDEIAEIVLFLATRRGNAVIDQLDVRRAAATPWG